jgi:DNA-directed RNA polymerase subunit RPC12/RpoP
VLKPTLVGRFDSAFAVDITGAAWLSSRLAKTNEITKSMSNYYCKYCGTKNTNLNSLTANPCPRHPLGPNKGKHVLYEGSEKAKYQCKFCGTDNSSLAALTANPCSRHPLGANKGKHEAAL